jgi:small subunit ribosomal protein S16
LFVEPAGGGQTLRTKTSSPTHQQPDSFQIVSTNRKNQIMAVAIRLRREGAKNRPHYKIVVADQRSPRDGKFIEIIGRYDPKAEGENFVLNLERAEYWVGVGARPSQTVGSMITKARKKQAAPAEA